MRIMMDHRDIEENPWAQGPEDEVFGRYVIMSVAAQRQTMHTRVYVVTLCRDKLDPFEREIHLEPLERKSPVQ